MVALDSGTASIVVATIGVVGSIILAMLEVVRRDMKSTRNHISAIDKSVNGVPEGTPPLVSRVSAIEARQRETDARQDASDRWMSDALTAIGAQLGAPMPNRNNYKGNPE